MEWPRLASKRVGADDETVGKGGWTMAARLQRLSVTRIIVVSFGTGNSGFS